MYTNCGQSNETNEWKGDRREGKRNRRSDYTQMKQAHEVHTIEFTGRGSMPSISMNMVDEIENGFAHGWLPLICVAHIFLSFTITHQFGRENVGFTLCCTLEKVIDPQR